MPLVTFASDPGTIGIAVNQLYSEPQPTTRGAFIVRRLDPSSAAADAGIQPGDLILAIDSKRVFSTGASYNFLLPWSPGLALKGFETRCQSRRLPMPATDQIFRPDLHHK
jgi:hypothetical protein